MGKKRGSKTGKDAGGAKEGGEPAGKEGDQAAVLSLKMDSSTPEAPREVAESGAFQTPCSISGLGAGVSGGMLGFVWGFGEWGLGWSGFAWLSGALWLAAVISVVQRLLPEHQGTADCCAAPQLSPHLTMAHFCPRWLLDPQHQGRRQVEGGSRRGLGLSAGAAWLLLCLLAALNGALLPVPEGWG